MAEIRGNGLITWASAANIGSGARESGSRIALLRERLYTAADYILLDQRWD